MENTTVTVLAKLPYATRQLSYKMYLSVVILDYMYIILCSIININISKLLNMSTSMFKGIIMPYIVCDAYSISTSIWTVKR